MSKKIIKKIFTNTGPKILFKNEKVINKKKLSNIMLHSFGNLNQNKIFYVIRRSPGAGMFSNLTFVMNHLLIAKQHNFIPVVDMKNFPTIYNEKNIVNGTYNAWEYYFEKVSKYTLEEVYKSKNVFITNNNFENNMTLELFEKKFNKIKKKINIKKKLYKEFLKIKKINFKNEQNILGVHFRGTTYKRARGHAFPLNKKLIRQHIDQLIKKHKYKKIFLVTEEIDYLKFMKKFYNDKLIYTNFFKSKNIDAFNFYPRKNHRYLLGREIIIETLLLSICRGLLYVKSNVSSASNFFSKKEIRQHEIFLGYNSRNKFISRWLWYLKSILPQFLGGLKNKKKNI